MEKYVCVVCGLSLIHILNAAVDEWRVKHNMGFALYGTPAESLTHRFSSLDRARFGIIEDITDKGYYTNSYHVSVREEINVFDKFSFESEFQKKSTGGCISYAEIPNMTNNIPAILTMIQYIYWLPRRLSPLQSPRSRVLTLPLTALTLPSTPCIR